MTKLYLMVHSHTYLVFEVSTPSFLKSFGKELFESSLSLSFWYPYYLPCVKLYVISLIVSEVLNTIVIVLCKLTNREFIFVASTVSNELFCLYIDG